jgi:hypothetical protein
MQADAGFLNHVQAAKKPGGRPGCLGTLVLAWPLVLQLHLFKQENSVFRSSQAGRRPDCRSVDRSDTGHPNYGRHRPGDIYRLGGLLCGLQMPA